MMTDVQKKNPFIIVKSIVHLSPRELVIYIIILSAAIYAGQLWTQKPLYVITPHTQIIAIDVHTFTSYPRFPFKFMWWVYYALCHQTCDGVCVCVCACVCVCDGEEGVEKDLSSRQPLWFRQYIVILSCIIILIIL